MMVIALESRVAFPPGVVGRDPVGSESVDESVSDLGGISIFFSPPTLTTWARACVAVLALLRNVEPTLNALAPLFGRPEPNLWKSIAGTGGVFGSELLFPVDRTLTTVGLARMPV